ncbi:MAG: hypothetical protein MJ192_09090 [Clostridia bacterium]|nr:hypothetical protein [Clostridia bacterium]
MENQQTDPVSGNGGIRFIDNGGRTAENTARSKPSLPDVRPAPRCAAYDDEYAPGAGTGSGSPGQPGENGGSGTGSGGTGITPGGDSGKAGGTAGGTAGDDPGSITGDNDGNGVPGQTEESGMTGSGTLIFQVTTAQGAVPLEGAQVTIYDYVPDSIPNLSGDPFMVMFSGIDGKTAPLTLPAPARVYSLELPAPDEPLPYSLYNATVELDGYYTQNFSMIPVFDGITSIQRLDLIPLPVSARGDRLQEAGSVITEGINPDLRR